MRHVPHVCTTVDRGFAEDDVFGTDVVHLADVAYAAKPYNLDGAGAVGEYCRQAHLGSFADGIHGHEAAAQLYGRHLARKVGDAVCLAAVYVVVREMSQQVVGRAYAQLGGQQLGSLGAYAFDVLYLDAAQGVHRRPDKISAARSISPL